MEEPLQVPKSEDFYITTLLQLECSESLEIETKWTIYSCTVNCSIQAYIGGSSIDTTFSELFIPARTLSYGLYKFKLEVSMVISPDIFSSKSCYVKINPTGITANLVKYGTSWITSGQDYDLTLDPGTHSNNPDETKFNASVRTNIITILNSSNRVT